MVGEAAARLPLELPPGHALDALLLGEPVACVEGGARKTGGVGEQVLDGHRALAVAAEGGDVVDHAVAQREPPFGEQHPARRCDEGLGDREDAEERAEVGGLEVARSARGADGAEGGEPALPCHGQLGRAALVARHGLRGLCDECLEVLGVDPHVAGVVEQAVVAHGSPPEPHRVAGGSP